MYFLSIFKYNLLDSILKLCLYTELKIKQNEDLNIKKLKSQELKENIGKYLFILNGEELAKLKFNGRIYKGKI